MTQKEQIWEHLKANGSITSKVAWKMYSITRLSSIINRLRKEMEIETLTERYKRMNWARYKLVK